LLTDHFTLPGLGKLGLREHKIWPLYKVSSAVAFYPAIVWLLNFYSVFKSLSSLANARYNFIPLTRYGSLSNRECMLYSLPIFHSPSHTYIYIYLNCLHYMHVFHINIIKECWGIRNVPWCIIFRTVHV